MLSFNNNKQMSSKDAISKILKASTISEEIKIK